MPISKPQRSIKSTYKYVRCTVIGDKEYWIAKITGEFRQTYATERQAAIGVDKYLITTGKVPVNILKPK